MTARTVLPCVVDGLRHDLRADDPFGGARHTEGNGTDAAVQVQQKIVRLQPGVLPRLGVEHLGGGGVDLVKFMHTHPQRHTGQRVLNDAGAQHGAGPAAQNNVRALTVAVDQNCR